METVKNMLNISIILYIISSVNTNISRNIRRKISQRSQENTCVGVSFLIKLQALKRDSNADVFL